ncbi:MAG: 2TM domain-containing protein, partial [Cyanobacteria bacterium P01_F01_bin.42]
ERTAVLRSYSQEQVQQILNLAIAKQVYEGEFSRSQLFEIADELGISVQCLQEAEQSWLAHQASSQERMIFDQHRQGQLRRKVERFGYTSGSLMLLNALTGFAWPWCFYMIGLMLLKLGFDTWTVFHQDQAGYEQAFRKWSRRRHLSQFVDRWWTRILSV